MLVEKIVGYSGMRRRDREVTDGSRIGAFIAKEQIIRIAFYDEGDIYIVPVNYGYLRDGEQYSFYFHGAKAGRKYELSKKTPIVGFEIDGGYELLEGKIACEFSATFQSVIGTGLLHMVEDRAEKMKGLSTIMKQTTSNAAWHFDSEMLERVAVFRLDVEKLSCKARE